MSTVGPALVQATDGQAAEAVDGSTDDVGAVWTSMASPVSAPSTYSCSTPARTRYPLRSTGDWLPTSGSGGRLRTGQHG